MLFVVLTTLSAASVTTNCTRVIVKERIIVGDKATQAYVDSLGRRLEKCKSIMKECCKIVVKDLKNN